MKDLIAAPSVFCAISTSGDCWPCAVAIGEGANPLAANDFGEAPLHNAAAIGDVETIHLLMSAGADLDAVGKAVIKSNSVNQA